MPPKVQVPPPPRQLAANADDCMIVKIVKKETKQFFAAHPELADQIPRLVDTFAESLAACLHTTSEKQTRDTLLDAIVSMQTSIKAMHDNTCLSLGKDINKMSETVSSNLKEYKNDINQQMYSCIQSIHDAIRVSLDKVSADSISTAVSKVVKTYMKDELDGFRHDQKNLKESIIAELKPIDSHHNHLVTLLQNIPEKVETMIKSAKSTDMEMVHNSIIEIRAKITDNIQTDKLQAAQISEIQKGIENFIEKVDDMWEGFDDETNKTRDVMDGHLKSLPTMVKGTLSDILKDMTAEKSNMLAAVRDIRSQITAVERGNNDTKSQTTAMMKSLPTMVKGTLSDIMKDMSAEKSHTLAVVKGISSQICTVERNNNDMKSQMAVVMKEVDNAVKKLDALTLQHNSNRFKGQTGENKLYDKLCDRLTERENFRVEQVTSQAHNCDFKISKLGFCDVRVETKAHGENTGRKVRQNEVSRFKDDLLSTNTHGIMVSLYSSIVGKGVMDIEQLSNGKFAVYLANNNFDCDVIYDMLQIIYRLDNFFAANNKGSDGDFVKIPLETLGKVRLYMKDFVGKIDQARTSAKEIISILNQVTFDKIEALLMGGTDSSTPSGPPTPPESVTNEFVCGQCSKHFKNKSGLATHMKIHKGISLVDEAN